MKYRTDFVTNSSSTSFGAAAGSALMALLTALLGTCSGEQPEETGEEAPVNGNLHVTKMPQDATKIVCEEAEPVWIYAQFVRVTEKGEVVDSEITSSISFSVSGGGWAVLGSPVQVDDWLAVDLTGVRGSSDAAPSSVTVTASVTVGKQVFRRRLTFQYEAPPALTVKPDKIGMLSMSGESFEAKVKIAPAGSAPWELSMDADSDASAICEASLEDVSANGDSALLKITESDTMEVSGKRLTDYYTSGKIVISGRSGEKEVSDYVTVTVYREGLYVSSGLTGDPRRLTVLAEAGPDGTMKVTELDLVYMKWDPQEKRLVSDPSYLAENLIIEEPEAEDEAARNVLKANPLQITYDRVRPSNIPSCVYKVTLGKVIPGKPEDAFRCSVTVSLEVGENSYSLDIPVVIKPAQMDKVASWQEEYENCKRIINTYMPPSKRDIKLQQLEKNKHYMGVADLQMFRRECWNIARDALVREAQDYLDEAAWYDQAICVAEWTVWLTDRAFNAVAGTVFGPIGAYAAGFVKNSIADIIVKCEENWDKDWYTICSEIVWSRLQDAVGSGIDTAKFSEPEVSAKFIASFVTYKFVWHLWFDTDDSGQRKGVIEALKAAAWDLTGVGIEKALEPFVKAKAARDGLVANEKLDELVKDAVAVIKTTLASVQG